MNMLTVMVLALGTALALMYTDKARKFWAKWQRFQAWDSVQQSVACDTAPALTSASADVLESPTDMTLLPGAARALAHPPNDLRISIAEIARNNPKGDYTVPLGWMADATKPSLVHAALVGDVNHVLVTGMSDVGKDNLVLTMFFSLTHRYDPTRLQFAILDGKAGLSWNGWHTKAHTWLFARHQQDIKTAMDSLSAERARREEVLWQAKAEKWEEYTGNDLPLLVVYVAELLRLQDATGKGDLAQWLNSELSSARSAGIRYIICTQNATQFDMRWRSNISLYAAGYQTSRHGDEPNTSFTAKELRELGQLPNSTVLAVPPSELPVPPAGAGVFTCIQGRSAYTVRATYLDKAQRQWWLNQLPEDPAKVRAAQHHDPLLAALVNGEPLPWEADKETPSINLPVPRSEPKQPVPMLRDLIRQKSLSELEQEPLFIQVATATYQRLGQVRPTTAEVFESVPGAKDGWTGSRHTIVTKVLRTSGVLAVDSPSPAVQAA